MKPISVSFQAFGPYRARQEIDFTALEKSGLFLICGETGSGKTTILDAICCALYGEASNKSRGELDMLRCKTADRSEETRVEFVFETNGKRYLFTRTLRFARVNAIDEHNCLEYRDGVYVPIFENPKKLRVNDKARELIGLTAEQFRQVIVLPQGRFETLLTSDSSEKEEILTSIFHADRWDRIERILADTVMQQRRQAQEQDADIRRTLQFFGCESLGALEEKRAAQAALLRDVRAQAATLEKEKQLRAREAAEAMLDAEAFAALDRAEADLAALRTDSDGMARLRLRLRDAEQAETAREPYMALCRAVSDAERAQNAVRQAQDASDEARRAKLLAAQALETHRKGKAEYTRLTGELHRLHEAKAVYADLEQTARALQNAQRAAAKAEQNVQACTREQMRRREQVQHASAVLDEAEAAYRQTRQRYLCSICGNLAQQALLPDAPCPVCGSTVHPAPAKPPRDAVSREAFDAAETLRTQAQEAFLAAGEAFERARAQTEAAKAAYTEALLRAEKAAADDENVRSRTIEGIGSAESLAAQTSQVQTKINLYEAEEEKRTLRFQEASAEETAKQQLLEKARENAAAAQRVQTQRQAQFDDACAQAGFADGAAYLKAAMEPQQMQTARQTEADHRAKLEAAERLVRTQREKVRGKTRRDSAALREAAAEAERAWNRAAQDAAVSENACRSMDDALQKLQRAQQAYDALRRQVEEDTVFQKRIAGSFGMSLKRYVLGVMLTSVTEQANRMLRDVYGGRYSLYRTNETTEGKRRSGLELEVLDHRGGVRRSVKTLSGGEKFLVALSLAIGLSTVVQSQSGGVRLDAMFIDEGFGTLDRNTMQDALDILRHVQRQNGIVGIISHVQTLAESIPAQIEIVKREDGSRCVVHGV